jgi:putative tryptophan/tyrosine transport system permease protein
MVPLILIIIEQTLLYIPLLIGSYLSFSLMKLPDLSIETAYVFGALLGTKVVTHEAMQGIHPLVLLLCALTASIVGGILVGTVNTLFTRAARVPHLLSAILTIGTFHTVMQLISNPYVSLHHAQNPLTYLSLHATHPELGLLFGIIALILCLLIPFLHTEMGYMLAVYGNNPEFFSNYGISTNYVFSVGLIMAHALAGCSGYLFAQSSGFFDIYLGFGKALLCITVLIIGKALWATRTVRSVLIPCTGAVLYFTIQQLLLRIGCNLIYFSALQALLVLLLFIVRNRNTLIDRETDHLGV